MLPHLYDLFKLKSSDQQNFKLLFRASRDGFGADAFHAKCDNQSKTITIVRTTKSFVFGGFTNACWSSNGQFKDDRDAFLFSLVNKFNKPFVCKIDDAYKAIECCSTFGPTFGTSDLYICDNANSQTLSYSKLENYKAPSDLYDPKGFYFCDTKNFLVDDFEVFQVFDN